jgi:hypothetical protein
MWGLADRNGLAEPREIVQADTNDVQIWVSFGSTRTIIDSFLSMGTPLGTKTDACGPDGSVGWRCPKNHMSK